MSMKTAAIVFLMAAVIFAGTAPGSLAHPEYLTSLSEVYGDGSCSTCHVKAKGGGPVNSYGTLFENRPDHVKNATAALIAIGPPPVATESPAAATTGGTKGAPGFGFLISLAGLFAWILLIRRNNR